MDLKEKLVNLSEENARLVEEKNLIIKEFNARMKFHLEEIRVLKEGNEKMRRELEELRELCCYLDDDRARFRQKTKEWQNVATHISSVLHMKEQAYQEQAISLCAQNENLNRKVENVYDITQRYSTKHNSRTAEVSSEVNNYSLASLNENSLSLQESYSEDSVTCNKRERMKKVSFLEPSDAEKKIKGKKDTPNVNSNKEKRGILRKHENVNGRRGTEEDTTSLTEMHREADVLTIKSNLRENRKEFNDDEMDVLKEMCNVVWRKLSQEDKTGRRTMKKKDDTVYEDLL